MRGPWVIVWGMALAASGCATEFNLATGAEERLLYDTEKEVRIGDAVARQLEAHYPLSKDIALQRRVERILDRLVPYAERKDVVFTVRVIDTDDVNAVSLPGGPIYVFRGLIEKVTDDDQLAAVIAHEMGHITARHGIKRLQASYGYTLVQLLAVASGDPALMRGAGAVYTSVFFGYSRKDELEADRLAVKYTSAAGYDPWAVVEMLKVLERERDKAAARPPAYFRTHPYISERKAAARAEIKGAMGFRDYLNLMGDDH